MTSEETLKELSAAIDAYAAAKMSNNESLIKYSIAELQAFLGRHSITPVEAPAEEAATPTVSSTLAG